MNEDISNLPDKFESLIVVPLPNANQNFRIAWAGRCIDVANDLAGLKENEKSRLLVEAAENILMIVQKQGPSKAVLANNVYYFLGGIWSDRVKLERNANFDPYFAGSEAVAKTIFYYRLCLTLGAKTKLSKKRRGEILTNLANTLNSAGRCIEAIDLWKESLDVDGNNGMSLGNIGQGFFYYGKIFQKASERKMLWSEARKYLEEGLSPGKHGVYPAAKEHFSKLLKYLKAVLKEGKTVQENSADSILGKNPEEYKYKKWVLEKKLFLNPLNDLFEEAVAAKDSLCFPDMLVSTSDENHTPWRHALFDQLKQEFVSARFMYFVGKHSVGNHFSDRNVLMIDSLDYPVYGFGTEQMRAAYRALFSILDKIAYFINHYLDLRVPKHKVSFHSFWYEKQNIDENKILAKISERKNWPLTGLFWLSRDLALGKGQKVLEPAMQDIKQIRNALEHKFLRLHSEGLGHDFKKETSISHGLSKLAFEEKGLKLLSLTRAALTYFQGAVYYEEVARAKKLERKGQALPQIPLLPYEDRRKQ